GRERELEITDLRERRKAMVERMRETLITADATLSKKERKRGLSALKKESGKESPKKDADAKGTETQAADAKGTETQAAGAKGTETQAAGAKVADANGTATPQGGAPEKGAAGDAPERLFVVEFDGSTGAAEVDDLALEIDHVLAVAQPGDELIVKLTSPGGVVNGYGLGASQLERVVAHGMILTCCVDTVAASGGYLMAAVAHRIVAAPFSYIGSIGVVAQLPNFHRVMDDHHVDYEIVTAGKYKRTLTMFGENTPEAREKMRSDLEAIHQSFKAAVARHRPAVDIDRVSTGEFWLATDALALGLVDEIATFDEYLGKRLDKVTRVALLLRPKERERRGLAALIRRLLGRDRSGSLRQAPSPYSRIC
nr:protease SohB [Succinivibrionaceae bacterium]